MLLDSQYLNNAIANCSAIEKHFTDLMKSNEKRQSDIIASLEFTLAEVNDLEKKTKKKTSKCRTHYQDARRQPETAARNFVTEAALGRP